MDYTRLPIKKEIKERMNAAGHSVLFLPPYSPDLNPIEKVFAHIKKRRMFAAQGTSLEQIIKEYG